MTENQPSQVPLTAITADFSAEYPKNKEEIKNFKVTLSRRYKVNFKVIEIYNCPTTSDASRLLSNKIFRSSFDSLKNFAILKLKVNEKLNVHDAKKPNHDAFNIKRNFLISFESTAEQYNGQKIIYWKNAGRFIAVYLLDELPLEMTDFVLKFFNHIINKERPVDTDMYLHHLADLSDSRSYNLLMKAIEDNQNSKVIDELLILSFYIDKKSLNNQTAADIALGNSNNQALLQLLEANSTFPDKFDINSASAEIKKFVKICDDMHIAINLEKEKEIQKLITSKPNLTYFYNLQNVSALTTAMKTGNSEIYKILTDNYCFNGLHEDITEIKKEISSPMKKKIRDINSLFSVNPFEKHLVTHLNNIALPRNDSQYKERMNKIIFAFNTLNEIDLTKEILELTAAKKNFKIHFDFNGTSTENMDLHTDSGTRGCYYPDKHHIYVAAKDLLSVKDDEKYAAIGTLAHELCHFAMNITFNNERNPYTAEDKENQLRFDEIVEKYRQQCKKYRRRLSYNLLKRRYCNEIEIMGNDKDAIRNKIDSSRKVFDDEIATLTTEEIYHKTQIMEHQNHIILLKNLISQLELQVESEENITDERKIHEYKESISASEKHIKQLEEKILIGQESIQNNNEMKNLFGDLDEIESSRPRWKNFHILALIGNLWRYFIYSFDKSFFNDMRKEDEKVYNDYLIMVKDCAKETDDIVDRVYNCYPDEKWARELIVRVPHMTAHYKNDQVKLEQLRKTFKDLFDYYETIRTKMTDTQKMWENYYISKTIKYCEIPDECKEELHCKSVIFQGNKVQLRQLIADKNSEAFQQLTSEQIRDTLFEKRPLTIGSKLKTESKNYIERDFHDFGENSSRRRLTFDEIVNEADKTKMILLSDQAGAGKTTFFEHLAVELNQNYQSHWVAYIDLKKHLKVYEKYEKNIDTLEILLEILGLTDNEHKLQKNFFIELYKANKIILLLDGVDEIAPIFKEFFLSFIESMRKPAETEEDLTKGEKNPQLWIATRPQHIQELMQRFKQKSYKLLPFDDTKKKEFIRNILIAKKPQMTNEEAYIDTESIFKSLKSSDSSSDYDINNPLMIKMITEHYADTGEVLSGSNLYSLYDKMIKKKLEITLEKKLSKLHDTEKTDAKLNIWEIHQMFALKLIFPGGFRNILTNQKIKFDEFLFFKKWQDDKEKSEWTPEKKQNDKKLKWTPEAISRHGFLFVDKWDTDDEIPDFVHRTFAEYFVTKFLIHDICKLDENDDMRESEIELRLKLLLSPEMKKSTNMWRFIESYLESNEFKEIIESKTKKKEKKICEAFYKLTISDDVGNYFNNNYNSDETVILIKFFSVDERFLQTFKYQDGKTIFEKYFRNSDEMLRKVYIKHDTKVKIFNAYQKSFGSEWHLYTTYNKSQEISTSDEEIHRIFTQSFTKTEHDCKKRILDEKTREKFFKLFSCIEGADLSRDYVKRFFERYYDEILNYFSNETTMLENFFETLQKNMNECIKYLNQSDANITNTLSHELCHLTINLTFLNELKPYSIDDPVNEERFSEISKKCKQIDGNYDENSWPSKLIFEDCNNQKWKEIIKKLYEYFDQVIVPNLIQTVPMLEKIFNNLFNIEYYDLSDSYKAKFLNSKVNFQGVEVKYNEIINNKYSKIFQHFTSKQVHDIFFLNKRLVIRKTQEIDTKYYIERDFIDCDSESQQEINFNQISLIADEKKIILLSVHAGAGKTTTFKHLSVKLKDKFPNFWISYIDLKRHLKVYEKFEQNFQAVEVLQQILDINDELDFDFFTELFESDRVILLYDGVDEIAPKFKDFFIKLVESVKNSTTNQQWIATRPQHMQELKNKFNQAAFKLLPYEDDKKTKLIDNVLKNLKVKNTKAEDALGFINKISDKNKIDNHLMLQIMTELYANDRTILEDSNLFSLYERMIDMKNRILGGKGEIVNKDRINEKSGLTIWKIHQIYALKLIFKDGFEDRLNDNKKIDINEFQLLKRWKKEKSNWTPEQISRYGFLIIINWNTENEFPVFVHRSFAEFFVAQFAIQDLYALDEDDDDEISEKEIELKVTLLIEIIKNNAGVRKFILSFVETHNSKRMNKHFYKFITSYDMQRILNRKNENYNDLIKVFSIDEQFAATLKSIDNETTFQ